MKWTEGPRQRRVREEHDAELGHIDGQLHSISIALDATGSRALRRDDKVQGLRQRLQAAVNAGTWDLVHEDGDGGASVEVVPDYEGWDDASAGLAELASDLDRLILSLYTGLATFRALLLVAETSIDIR